MKLRTKLQISAFLSLSLALVIALTLMLTIRQVEKARKKDRVSNEIIKGVFELNILTYDYLLHPQERPQSQWHSKHASVEKLLESGRFSSLEETLILTHILQNHRDIKSLFSQLIQNISLEQSRVLIGQLLVKSHAMASSGFQLLTETNKEVAVTQQRSNLLVMTFVIIVAAFLALIAVLISRSIVSPIMKLHEGTEIIAGGRLDHKVDIGSDDEIGALSHAFNAMTDKLRASYAALEEEIAERKRTEEALIKSTEKYKELVHNANSIILRRDTHGKLTFFNEFAQNFFGYPEEEVLGRDLMTLLPNTDTSGRALTSLTEEMMKDPERCPTVETEIMLRNGRRVWVAWTNKAIRDDNGHIVEILSIGNDITEIRRGEEERERLFRQVKAYADALQEHRDHLEEMIRERTRELRSAQEKLIRRERLFVLGQLTATVSHELRNPLGVIRSSTFYLKRKMNSADEKIIKHLDRIERQVALCNSIVGELLEYTRGRQSDAVQGEVSPWLLKVLDRITVTMPREVTLTRDLTTGLPMIRFDTEKMERVMINVIENAVQAVTAQREKQKERSESYEPKVRVFAEADESGVIIGVEDNGIGMDEETAGRAFEPLFTTRARGTGLGLAVVRKIVEEHGGTVLLASKPGEGTRLSIVIPFENVDKEGQAA